VGALTRPIIRHISLLARSFWVDHQDTKDTKILAPNAHYSARLGDYGF
jgi:hypothetical protein